MQKENKMVKGARFELARTKRPNDLKSSALDHSANPPNLVYF